MANETVIKGEVDVRGLFFDYLEEDFGDYDSAIVVGKCVELIGQGLDRVEGGDVFRYMCRALQECGYSCDEWVEYYFKNVD